MHTRVKRSRGMNAHLWSSAARRVALVSLLAAACAPAASQPPAATQPPAAKPAAATQAPAGNAPAATTAPAAAAKPAAAGGTAATGEDAGQDQTKCEDEEPFHAGILSMGRVPPRAKADRTPTGLRGGRGSVRYRIPDFDARANSRSFAIYAGIPRQGNDQCLTKSQIAKRQARFKPGNKGLRPREPRR